MRGMSPGKIKGYSLNDEWVGSQNADLSKP
jgi:hypothetical protein